MKREGIINDFSYTYQSLHILGLHNHKFPSHGLTRGFYHPQDHLWQVQNQKVWHCNPEITIVRKMNDKMGNL